MVEAKENEFEGWALLELMGHRKLAGYVRPATIGGAVGGGRRYPRNRAAFQAVACCQARRKGLVWRFEPTTE